MLDFQSFHAVTQRLRIALRCGFPIRVRSEELPQHGNWILLTSSKVTAVFGKRYKVHRFVMKAVVNQRRSR